MVASDFKKYKQLDVASVSGTPTISRTVCLKITGGDDSTTGTGDIVLDWSNISSEADIGVYDENDDLLDYYFEAFSDSDEEAVIWVFRDWVQDGSTQLQVAYGDGPSDQSVSAGTVFDKESDLEAGYLFNEDSGDLLDITSNSNDGTVSGVTRGNDGIVDGAYSFDGSDDRVDLSIDTGNNIMDFKGDSSFSVAIAFKLGSTDQKDFFISSGDDKGFYIRKSDGDVQSDGSVVFKIDDGSNDAYLGTDNTYDDNNWHLAVLVVDANSGELIGYVDGSQVGSAPQSVGDLNNGVGLGEAVKDGSFAGYNNLNGFLDDLRIYSSALSLDEISALYDAIKVSPDFFSQQAAKFYTIGYLDGYVVERNTPVQREVYLYRRVPWEFIDNTTSSGTDGYFYIETRYDEPHNLICLASGSNNYPDLFYSKVYPTLF